jgi:16S rRNA (cytosine967-C5)-methyltransferase
MATLEEHKIKDLYSGVRGIAVKILNRVERTDSYLDRLLDQEMKYSELSGPDKALLYEIVHGVTRWMGRLDWILNGFYKGQFSKAIPNLKNGLRVALYQILFLDKVPDFAAVNEAVEFVKKLQGQRPADLTNAILRNIIRSKAGLRYPNPDEDLPGYIAAFYSHPSWMVKRYLKRFTREEVEKLLAANNEKPVHTLKINLNKTSPKEFKDLLRTVGLRYIQGRYLDDFFKLQNLTNITSWEYFTKGYFDIQDEAAGVPCRLLDPKPGMKILDLCAAPGGKSSYIASLIKDEGQIVSIDKFESRISIFRKNIERMGYKSIQPVVVDALEYNESGFDRVLADVPCSGTGTLSKKPDIKWKRELLDIKKMSVLQYELLEKAASLVAVNGAVVYSTCSIEPEEDQDIVNKFLAEHSNFELENAAEYVHPELVTAEGFVLSLPHKHHMDGAFSARLVRKN